LARLADEIGQSITIRPHFGQSIVYFTINFWPQQVVHNPEDEEEYDDIPHLEA
jgi:hypothetical protein